MAAATMVVAADVAADVAVATMVAAITVVAATMVETAATRAMVVHQLVPLLLQTASEQTVVLQHVHQPDAVQQPTAAQPLPLVLQPRTAAQPMLVPQLVRLRVHQLVLLLVPLQPPAVLLLVTAEAVAARKAADWAVVWVVDLAAAVVS